MFTIIPSRIEIRGTFWTLFWFFSEFVGEIGLIIRYAGACFFLVFCWYLIRKSQFSFSFFRKAVLFEGVNYLFYIPFIINLFTRPANGYAIEALTTYRLTALSYLLQTILVFSSFIILYIKTKNENVESTHLYRWGAVAVVCYVFALWVKHFLFTLYALPMDVSDPVLLAGLLNSSLTILVGAFVLLFTLRFIIVEKKPSFNSRAVGASFFLVSAFFFIYILVSLVNSHYLAFLPLTELWAITFSILGISFFINKRKLREF
jgi:hypothetical protein